MKCRVAYTVNGQRAHTTVNAPSTIEALLLVMKCLPDFARVAAIVSVIKQPLND